MTERKKRWEMPELTDAAPSPAQTDPEDDRLLRFHLGEIGKYGSIPGDFKGLSGLLWHLEEASGKLRDMLLDMESPCPSGRKPAPGSPDGRGCGPGVTATVTEDALVVSAPGTLLRSEAESWHIAREAERELKRYEAENGVRLSGMFRCPAYIIVRRKALRASKGYRDNENLEVTKTINAICSCLGYSDGPANIVSYTSSFELVDDLKQCGTEFIIFEKNKLKNNSKYFSV